MENLIGKKFGKLTILEVIKKEEPQILLGYKYYVRCKCDCGKEKTTSLQFVRYGGRKGKPVGCGCQFYQYKKGVENYISNGCGEILGRKWGGIKANAKMRNIPFELTIQQAWEKFLEQNRKCIYTGEELHFRRTSYDYEYDTASLDRIDSLFGYTAGNFQWVHKKVNEIKWDLTNEKFLKLCYFIINPIQHDTPNQSCIVIKHKGGFEGVGNLGLKHWNRILKNARDRNILVDVNIKDAWELFVKQKGYCALTGLPIYFKSSIDITASLDRIDVSRGYVYENIQWVHKDINYKLKKHYSEVELKTIAKKIIDTKKINYEDQIY